jgi:hypothetical protein|tara:strand:- start:196 stop:597 length:402 start_codon:yes stop_codon:yes gene_type:complete
MADNILDLNLQAQRQLVANTAVTGTGDQKLLISDSSGHLKTVTGLASTGFTAQTTVGTTAAQLSANTVTHDVTFLADTGNSSRIYLAFSEATATSSAGFPLSAGASYTAQVNDTDSIWVVAGSSNQTLHMIGS